MKTQVILLLFLSISAHFFGQEIDVKCDSFRYSIDSSKVLVYKKRKTGIYSIQSKQFLVEPNQSKWAYFKNHDVFIEIYDDNFELHHFAAEKHVVFVAENNQIDLTLPNSSYLDIDYNFTSNGYYNKVTGEFADSVGAFYFNQPGHFKIERINQSLFLIEDYSPVETDLYYEEIPIIESLGYARSGVFDFSVENWVILPNYEQCFIKEDLIFCSRRDSMPDNIVDEQEFFNYNKWQFNIFNTFDIFKLESGQFNLKYKDIDANGLVDLNKLWPSKSFSDSGSEIYFITEKNGKKGLIQMQFFNDYKLIPTEFIFKQILPNQYDFIQCNWYDKTVITFDKSKPKPIEMFAFLMLEEDTLIKIHQDSNNLKVLRDTVIVEPGWGWEAGEGSHALDFVILGFDTIMNMYQYNHLKEKDEPRIKRSEIELEFFEKKYLNIEYGIELFNDSLLYVVNHQFYSTNLYMTPLKSQQYPDEDSAVFDNVTGMYNAVYPDADNAIGRSGVYNINQQKWFVDPIYHSCKLTSEGILAEKIIRYGPEFSTDDSNFIKEFSLFLFKHD